MAPFFVACQKLQEPWGLLVYSVQFEPPSVGVISCVFQCAKDRHTCSGSSTNSSLMSNYIIYTGMLQYRHDIHGVFDAPADRFIAFGKAIAKSNKYVRRLLLIASGAISPVMLS